MATIVQAPFYVPRPSDDTFWVGVPLASNVLMPLLTAGGQPPTKHWHASFQLDDSSGWQGQPIASALLHPLLTAVGKAISRQWLFGYDDPARWMGEPDASAVISLLTAVKLYGVGGQGPTKQWHYDYDDAAGWLGQSDPSALLSILLTAAGQPPTKRWRYDFDIGETFWLGHATTVGVNYLPTPAVFPTAKAGQWRFGLDDAAGWQGQPLSSDVLSVLLTAAGQPPTKRWRYDFDEGGLWSGQPVAIGPFYLSVPVTFPTATASQWRFGLDDAAGWQGKPSVSTLLAPLLTAAGQPPTKSWRYDYSSGETFWQGQPTTIGVNYIPSTGAFPTATARQWQFGNDDVASWQGQPLASALLHPLLTAAGQPSTKRWRSSFEGDDGSFYWLGQPLSSHVLFPLLTAGGIVKAHQWLPGGAIGGGDTGDTFWEITASYNSMLLSTSQAVITPKKSEWIIRARRRGRR